MKLSLYGYFKLSSIKQTYSFMKLLYFLCLLILPTYLITSCKSSQQQRLNKKNEDLSEAKNDNTLNLASWYYLKRKPFKGDNFETKIWYMKKIGTIDDTSRSYKLTYEMQVGDFKKTIIEYGDVKTNYTGTVSHGTANTIPQTENKFAVIRQETFAGETTIKNIPTTKLVKTVNTLASNKLRLEKLRQKGDTLKFKFVPIIDERKKLILPYENSVVNKDFPSLLSVVNTQQRDSVVNRILVEKLDSLGEGLKDSASNRMAITKIPDVFYSSLKKGYVVDFAYASPYKVNAVNTAEKPVDFFVIKTDESNPIKVTYSSIVVGTLVVPFKFRPGNDNKYYIAATSTTPAKEDKVTSSVESKLNIGFYVGLRWGKMLYPSNIGSNSNFTVGLFVSPQSIAMSTSNSRFDRIDLTNPTRQYNTLGTTIGLTGVYTYKQVSVALLWGFDFAHGNAARVWVYQGKPWIGFGLGYKLPIFNNG